MKSAKEFTIKDNLRGFELEFKSTWGLFSHQIVDRGTQLLIENIKINDGDRCLDLGCGWGAVGVVMAKLSPKGMVTFLDRDITAISYSQLNCRLNRVGNARFELRNGLEGIEPNSFEIVASNLPTHISNEMLGWLITGVKEVLVEGGNLYVVTISKLKPFIKRVFEEAFGNFKMLAEEEKYTVSRATKL